MPSSVCHLYFAEKIATTSHYPFLKPSLYTGSIFPDLGNNVDAEIMKKTHFLAGNAGSYVFDSTLILSILHENRGVESTSFWFGYLSHCYLDQMYGKIPCSVFAKDVNDEIIRRAFIDKVVKNLSFYCGKGLETVYASLSFPPTHVINVAGTVVFEEKSARNNLEKTKARFSSGYFDQFDYKLIDEKGVTEYFDSAYDLFMKEYGSRLTEQTASVDF